MSRFLRARVLRYATICVVVWLCAARADAQGFDDDDSENELWLAVGIGIGAAAIASSPFWGPPIVTGDTGDFRGYFPEHPYQDDYTGFMMIEPVLPLDAYDWSIRSQVDYVIGLDDLSGANMLVYYEHASRFGIEGETSYRVEDFDITSSDGLLSGNVNVLRRFAQSQHLQFRAGAGVSWLADGGDTGVGWNLTYGVDSYPQAPWVVSGKLDWGQVDGENLLHARGTLGAQWDGLELYSGYDYYDYHTTELNGFIAGLRLWF